MIDRMAIAIVDGSQARRLLDALREADFRVTVVDAIGGFFHEAMVTLIVGMEHERLDAFFRIVEAHCPRRRRYVSLNVVPSAPPAAPMMIEASVGGATVFVVPVERFVQL